LAPEVKALGSGQVPDRRTHADVKVFWFFSSEKNKDSSFSEEKEARSLLLLVLRDDTTRAVGQPSADYWSGHCMQGPWMNHDLSFLGDHVATKPFRLPLPWVFAA
jgi:hypothetical protein